MADGEGAESHDVRSILSGVCRDFLVRNGGELVKVEELEGKTIGIYFSAHWCGPCRSFTPKLVDVYSEVAASGFEVVFVSADEDEAAFSEYFSEMPWLAVPFSDSATRDRLDKLFGVTGIPHLVVLEGSTGKVLIRDAFELVTDHGVAAFPFTPERVQELKEEEEEARRNQTLRSLLTSPTRDYVLNCHGDKVPVTEIDGKTVGLYFFVSTYAPCIEFTPLLRDMYEELQNRGEKFEIVVLPLDGDDNPDEEQLSRMPFFTLPLKDITCEKLQRYFDLHSLPTLVVIGADGKTVLSNAAQLVEDHGVSAYPFNAEKIEELEAIEKAKAEAQTLESLLVTGDIDYVIGKDGAKIPIAELVGKNILLYFSAHWCPPCRSFLPVLVKAYHEIKAKDSAFEVIFISSDEDESSFKEFFATMPWLALPFGDGRKKQLSRTFKIPGIPSLVVIGPSGRTVTKEAREMVSVHGSAAYPFTEERLKELEVQIEEMVKQWPEKIKHTLHEAHELVLVRRMSYACDECEQIGQGWSYYCQDCDFDLHPKCALKEAPDIGVEEPAKDEGADACICDGHTCCKPQDGCCGS